MAGQPYVVITADSHAGASVETYRDYLDEKHKALFDEWRGSYRNPQRKHIGSKKHKNWDDAERMKDMETEGMQVRSIFPNTVPPFFRTSVLICGNPSVADYPRWLEGIRAHNRWLVDFCAEAPERRAGIGIVYLNDIDEAIRDVEWIAKHGLRGGVLLPHVPPDCTHITPLYAPEMDRFYAACQDHDVVLNQHGGTGLPITAPGRSRCRSGSWRRASSPRAASRTSCSRECSSASRSSATSPPSRAARGCRACSRTSTGSGSASKPVR